MNDYLKGRTNVTLIYFIWCFSNCCLPLRENPNSNSLYGRNCSIWIDSYFSQVTVSKALLADYFRSFFGSCTFCLRFASQSIQQQVYFREEMLEIWRETVWLQVNGSWCAKLSKCLVDLKSRLCFQKVMHNLKISQSKPQHICL